MISDKLLVNLKILSKIQKNGRISRSFDGIIGLENEAVYQPLKRFLTNDSRKQAIYEINSIVNESIEVIRNIINSKHTNTGYAHTDEYIKNCENIGLLITQLGEAKIGIENLKFTYQVDLNTTSQLDIIMLKINTCVKDATQKLLYLQNYIESECYVPFVPQNKKHNNQEPYELKSIQVDTTTHSPVSNNFDLTMTDINSLHPGDYNPPV